MSAEKYLLQGRKANFFKRYFSPIFNSVKSYVLQLGFLDGRKGWVSAITIAYYSWLKYFYLHQLLRDSKIKEISFTSKARVERAWLFFSERDNIVITNSVPWPLGFQFVFFVYKKLKTSGVFLFKIFNVRRRNNSTQAFKA